MLWLADAKGRYRPVVMRLEQVAIIHMRQLAFVISTSLTVLVWNNWCKNNRNEHKKDYFGNNIVIMAIIHISVIIVL